MIESFDLPFNTNPLIKLLNYNKLEFDSLCITKNKLFLNGKDSNTAIDFTELNSIKIDRGVFFATLHFYSEDNTFSIPGIGILNCSKINNLCLYLCKAGFIEDDYALVSSALNATKYICESYNKSLLEQIKQSPIYNLKPALINELHDKHKKYLSLFKDFINNNKKLIDKNNQKFIEAELIKYKGFFDNIESNPLTRAQRISIITNEDNNLIVAGAGSGKTSVIVGKVLYLLEKQFVTPSEILILAFNKKAQEEISNRLGNKTDNLPDIKTFHGLGNHIIRHGKNKKSLSKIATDQLAFKHTLKALIQNNLEDEGFSNIIRTYFQEFFYPMPNISNFKTDGDYYNYLENFEIRTLNGERVKSLEECYIANFLYLNGIKYEYEKTYPYDCSSKDFGLYKPDFYLTDFDIYIEHFAINRNGVTPDFIPNDKYIEGIKWKRKTHELFNTTLIETYSWENFEGLLLKNLEQKLIKNNIAFKPIDKKNMFQKLNKFKHVDSFTDLISSFLNHFKSNQVNIESLFDKINSSKDSEKHGHFTKMHKMRNNAFLNVFNVIYSQYEKRLKTNNENDFNDMILLATKFLDLGFYKPQYKYILVDEFQDISKGRALLLKELAKASGTKLFCVGDDWQSIYRFTGSDISLMVNFQEEFGYTKRIDLDMTFRFDDQINDVATKFITQNEKQLKKEINTLKKSDLPSVLIYYKDNENDAIKTVLQEIKSNLKEKDKNKVLILSRFNKLMDKDKSSRESFRSKLAEYRQEFKDLDIEFSSVHGSKGLGFDYVIVIDMNRGAFPLEKIDDPILSLVMPKPEEFPNAEERRLFYVALTRAKEKVYLVPEAKPSSFIDELESGGYNIGTYGSSENTRKMKCPKCGTGLLIKSNSKKSFICSHINYCDFVTPICDKCQKGYFKYSEKTRRYECTNPRCREVKAKCPAPDCQDGFLVVREGKHGKFYGCSNYPKCNHSQNISRKHSIRR